MKRCSHCRAETADFGPNRAFPDGLQKYCRPCARAAGRKYSRGKYVPIDPALAHHRRSEGQKRRRVRQQAFQCYAGSYWTSKRMFPRFRASPLWWALFLRLWTAVLRERLARASRKSLASQRTPRGIELRRLFHLRLRLKNAYRSALRKPKARRTERGGLEAAYRKVLRRQNNKIERRLAERLRRRFAAAFHYNKSTRIVMEMTGTSLSQLRLHIESLWKPGMSWDNYGFRGWHIDHIKPICQFNIRDPQQAKEAFNWQNLQPLWMKENLTKGKKAV